MKNFLYLLSITFVFVLSSFCARAQTIDWSCYNNSTPTLNQVGATTYAFTGAESECPQAAGFTFSAVGTGPQNIFVSVPSPVPNSYIRIQKSDTQNTFTYASFYKTNHTLFTLTGIAVAPTSVNVQAGGLTQMVTVHAYRSGTEVGSGVTVGPFNVSPPARIAVPLTNDFVNIDEVRINSSSALAAGIGIDDIVIASTGNVPDVTTIGASAITVNSATLTGSVSSDGGNSVSEKGIVYGLSNNPTIANTKLINGSGTGAISANATGLTNNTTYHYRAYATNIIGTNYGADQNFKTLTPNNLPVAVADNYTYTMGVPLVVTTPGILNNDTDADNNPLSVILVSWPAHGALVLNANGSFIYTPSGTTADQFTYKVNDGTADGNTVTVTLTQASPMISTTGALSALTTTYGTASSSGTFNVSGTNLGTGILVTAPTGFEVSTNGINFSNTVTVGSAGTLASTLLHIRLASGINAGTYSGNVVLSSAGAASVNVATVASAVNKAVLTITANNVNKVYGAVVPALGVSYSGFVGTDNEQSLTSQPIIITPAATSSPVNSYPITAGGAVSANYTFVYQPGILSVTPALLTITANNKGKVFGQALTGGPASTEFTTAGLVNSETVGSVTITYGAGAAAGAPANTYTGSVVASAATGGTFNAGNYNLTYVAGSILVGQAALTITANSTTKVYGAPVPALTVSYSGFIGTDDASSLTIPPSIITTAALNSPVNTYPITVSGAGSQNYTIVYNPGTLTITPATLIIKADHKSKVYGQVLTGATGSTAFTSTGLLGAETIGSVAISYGAGAGATDAVADYTGKITASAATGGTFNANNYAISYAPGDITVNPAPLTIAATGPARHFGTGLTAGASTTDFTVSTLQNSEMVNSVTLTPDAAGADPATPAGAAYVVTPSAATGASGFLANNYAIIYTPFTGTVGSTGQFITFNPLPAVTYGDAPVSLNATASSGLSITYVSADPSVAAVSGSTITIMGAGTTTITASQEGNGNFTAAAAVPQSITVSPKALTVTAGHVTKAYGQALSGQAGSTAFTSIGLLGAETIGSVAISYGAGARATDAVADYTGNITASVATGGTFNANNYMISYVPGNITVNQAPLTIVATGPAKPFGTVLKAGANTTDFTVNTLQNGETVNGVTLTPDAAGADPATPAGSAYVMTPSAATGANGFSVNNYNITYTPFTGTVGSGAQSITFNPLPAVTYGDVPVSLGATASSGLPITYTSSDPSVATVNGNILTIIGVGTATITASQEGNSNFTAAVPEQQSVTVSPKTLTITADNVTKTYGQILSDRVAATIFTAVGLVGAETVSSVNITYGTGAAATDAVGSYKAKVMASAAAGGTFNANNYMISYVPGNITVNPAVLTITATGPAKPFGVTLTAGVSMINFTVSDTQNSETVASVTLTPDAAGLSAATPAGTAYLVTPSVATGTNGFFASNYNIIYKAFNGTVGNNTQNITFSVLANAVYGQSPITLTGAASSGLGVNYTSSNTGVAIVSGNTLIIRGAGSTIITAIQAGNANYRPAADVLQTLTVDPKAITITADAKSKKMGKIDPVLTYQVTTGSLVGTDTFTGALIRNAGENVGVYAIKQGTTTLNNNYVLTYNGADLSIELGEGPLSISATNILTPNGDGKNDYWVIQDIQLYPENNVTVYDKAGRVVYNKHGYTNDWDGSLRGSPLNEGTYYYTVELGRAFAKFRGSITILRSH